jgi:6-phosphogluconolactonase/glucosamine-6-phosphate isomerase/deaminase
MMQYRAATTPEAVARDIAESIRQKLQSGERVLWLVSGGSTIPIAVAAAQALQTLPGVRNLTILQVDERYGELGHRNANWQALLDAGFSCGDARCIPILRAESLAETTQLYEADLRAALAHSDFRVGLFGIGADGHTAGMLPGSSAAQETERLVASYHGPDFTRITITTPAIAQLDLAIVYAVGHSKASALRALQQPGDIIQQPAQALRHAAQTTVYTDYQGDSL